MCKKSNDLYLMFLLSHCNSLYPVCTTMKNNTVHLDELGKLIICSTSANRLSLIVTKIAEAKNYSSSTNVIKI